MAIISIIGATTWGNTIGRLLVNNGAIVNTWTRTESRAKELSEEQSKLTESASVEKQVNFTGNIATAMHEAEVVVLGVPAQSLRQNIKQLNKYTTNKKVKSSIYHIKISAYKAYWLHIEMNAMATLAELDQFLRDIWLECCGHLSEFTINGIRYETSPSDDWLEMDSKSMNVQLRKVLKVKDKFSYEYDFGSTTTRR